MRTAVAATLAFLLLLPASSALAGTRAEPEAADPCGVDEIVDTYDLTWVDAPWADLCAAWLDAEVAGEDVRSLSVTWQLADMVDSRTPTGLWGARLKQGGCVHDVFVADDGIGGEASVSLTSSCGGTNIECGEPWTTINDTLEKIGVYSSCSAGTSYEQQESVDLPLDSVTFGQDTVAITIATADMTGILRNSLAPGARIDALSAHTGTAVAVATPDGPYDRALVDADVAASTGRSFVVGS